MIKKLIPILFFLICNLFLIGFKSNAQEIRMYLKGVENCRYKDPYYTFYGIENKMILWSSEKVDFKKYNVKCDSVEIKRINDSIFILKPKYPDVVYKIYIIDETSKNKIATIRTTSISNFLIATIFDPDFRPNSVYNFKYVISKLEKLRFNIVPCLDYLKYFKIKSLTIILKRKDQIILNIHLDKNKVPQELREAIILNAKKNDELIITDIKAKYSKGGMVEVNDYKLLIRDN